MLFHSIPRDINLPVLFAVLTAEHSKRSLKLTKPAALLINITGLGSVLHISASILRYGWLSSKSHSASGQLRMLQNCTGMNMGEGLQHCVYSVGPCCSSLGSQPQEPPGVATVPPGTAALCVSSAGTLVPSCLFGSLQA